jgi:hypothetical protein
MTCLRPSRLSPLMALVGVALVACGPAPQKGTLVSSKLLTSGADLVSENGMTTNGMTTNGMTTNGMKGNGLLLSGANSNSIANNGLTNATLASGHFHGWFNSNSAYSNMVMTYLVRCAVPAGQTRSYKHGNTTYSWQGLLGLAPFWSTGTAISQMEQDLVSACLGAHANRFGVHVPFSIVGFKGDQTLLTFQPGEAAAYPNPEGAFFGNIFNGGEVYSCSSNLTNADGISGPRECAMGDMPTNVCSPLVDTGSLCSQICYRMNLPGLGNAYVACIAPDGQWYPALTTALSDESIYWCGDGTCQFTESCYDRSSDTGCLADCGKCK